MNPRLRAILVNDARRALDHRKQAQDRTASDGAHDGAGGTVAVAEYLKRNLRHRPWLAHRKARH